ncbi:MAG TPA: NAD(P)/FAD-dependent oxidoreductase [Terriglobales bacterium]|nr:NAD(P)/FAD-dependent oxidoreductase [Terriglobales bacterium]
MAKPRVVIIGGGFGGLTAAAAVAQHPVTVTVIDRKNHHTFQPLLYQVATAGLSPGEIAAPIRAVLSRYKNVSVLMAEVCGFDLANRRVKVGAGCKQASQTSNAASDETPANFEIDYDYLIVAAGATHSYFGHEEWEAVAPGLKTIEDALEIRRRVLLAFELAERQAIATGAHDPLNFVVIGGGPTGVELAGTLAEVANRTLAMDFRAINPRQTRVILVEGMARVLPTYPEDLSRSAQEQLQHLGVEVRTSTRVTGVTPGAVMLGDTALPSAVTLWAAGVAASPLGRMLGNTDKAGRVLVEPDLSIGGHPEVFVIGDLASLAGKEGKPLPGLAPVAMQQGRAVARTIDREMRGLGREPFHYHDHGTMSTIGRAAAVADFGKFKVSGFVAWVLWLLVHIMFLIGFRNRLLVMLDWFWAYLTYQRSARLITGNTTLPGFPRGVRAADKESGTAA